MECMRYNWKRAIRWKEKGLRFFRQTVSYSIKRVFLTKQEGQIKEQSLYQDEQQACLLK